MSDYIRYPSRQVYNSNTTQQPVKYSNPTRIETTQPQTTEAPRRVIKIGSLASERRTIEGSGKFFIKKNGQETDPA